jgi:hypothetical protein
VAWADDAGASGGASRLNPVSDGPCWIDASEAQPRGLRSCRAGCGAVGTTPVAPDTTSAPACAGKTVIAEVLTPDAPSPRYYRLRSQESICLPAGARVRARLEREPGIAAGCTIQADTNHHLVKIEGFDTLLIAPSPELEPRCSRGSPR